MSNNPENSKESFVYPLGSYHGKFSPANVTFNANLQEFAQKVSLICGLETNGKISTQEAYKQIKELWHQLKRSKQELLDNNKLDRSDNSDS
jgi:polyhydroxyalkanoate synthesis regulator phasin